MTAKRVSAQPQPPVMAGRLRVRAACFTRSGGRHVAEAMVGEKITNSGDGRRQRAPGIP